MEKLFDIDRSGRSVGAIGMGRIMFRPEAADIVGSYNSIVRGMPGDTYVDLVPPIEKERLKELGERLVELAKALDPSPPDPDYKII